MRRAPARANTPTRCSCRAAPPTCARSACLDAEAAQLFERYAPLCALSSQCFVVAHLARASTVASGHPVATEAITGPEDMAHNHRMRALFDVVLVGAGTVCHDDPSLTCGMSRARTRCAWCSIPTAACRRSTRSSTTVSPHAALVSGERCRPGERHGQAEVVGVAGDCAPLAVIRARAPRAAAHLHRRRRRDRVALPGARCLDRLQLAVSPLIMGQGRPGIDLGETLRLRPWCGASSGRRYPVRVLLPMSSEADWRAPCGS
jgi:riboflavin biosynthesis pyrimidine reductase